MIKFGSPVSVDIETHLPRLVEALTKDDRLEAAWLFGSRARNEADDLSDVDIAGCARRPAFPEHLAIEPTSSASR